jgi:hypothetical protein
MDAKTLFRSAVEHTARPDTRQAFHALERNMTAFGALGAAALLAVIVVSSTGPSVNTFMWVRAALLPAVAVLMHRMSGSASRGAQRAFDRVRTIVDIMPIAIIGVDLVPGACPPWYAGVQAVCMLPVIVAAFLTHGPALGRRS